MKLLVAADLHLGRRPGRLPETVDPAEVSAAATWAALVKQAIERRVDAVCLCGDVVDHDNRFWEAIGPLERGLNRLHEAGITALAVAGNHDHDVLTRLAQNLGPEKLRLLGAGGQWQRLSLPDEQRPAAHFYGFSFPQAELTRDPVGDLTPEPTDTAPAIAMVHGDLDAADSKYGPLDAAVMRSKPIDAWLLGHIHQPGPRSDRPVMLYPGSPQGLDPGEPGLHGAWLMEIGADGVSTPQQIALSAVRYETVEADLTDLETEDEAEATLYRKLREAADRFAGESGAQLTALSLRLRLTGQTNAAGRLGQIARRIESDYEHTTSGVAVTVDRVFVEAAPAIDLDEYARLATPPGAVARLLQQLDDPEPSPEVRELIRRTQHKLSDIRGRPDYAPLHEPADADEREARDELRAASRKLLAELAQQQP